ncbi:LuxR family transcriptional regulator [Amycolatopsis panacis]|uniref:LuxR family transcriptional regulator n=1 Tax=Amycolatopsis panacis TaxID=2340917 RepID=A0A419HJZ5_9PSEU|nr:LuxR family transcriptional regulator [Amycolatopsis panacis]
MVDPRLAEVLRARLIRVAQGRERRFRGTFTGLVPASGNAVTLVASIWRAPAPAILLIVLPEGAPAAGPAPGAGPISLTDLEARILQGVARGLSSADLASELYLSRQGIDYHVVRLQRRVKAKNRAELVSRAYTAGLLDPGNWPPRVLAARHAS